MKNNFIILLILISTILSFSSCNTLKYVSEDEYLLTKNSVFVNNKKNVDSEITDYIVQRPNQLVLGVPFPLYFYNLGNKNFESDYEQWKLERPNTSKFITSIFSEKQTKGLHNFKKGSHNWFLNNGESPVIFDPKKANQTVKNLTQHYYNEGYFNAKVNFEKIKNKHKKVSLNYTINTGKAYTLDTITTNIESKVLDSIYAENKEQSYIKSGKQFRYELFLDEQDRINELFRNSGIYRFNKNAILVEADTANYKSNINLIINDSIADVPFVVQKIKNITIYTDYSFNTKDEPTKDSLNYNGYLFLSQKKLKYNPKLLLESIFIEPNTIYKDETRELTRKNLRRLNNFKNITIRYEEKENDFLEASIYLSPLKKYSIGTSAELTHSNIRQLGISGKLSFSNLNIFKGAEILKFSVQGSFLDSKDAADNSKLLNAWEVGGDISLEVPRILFPFKPDKIIPKNMAPNTILTLGTSLQKNIGLDKQKFTGIIDYTWESTPTKKHSLQILNAQFIKNLNVDSYFNIYKSEFNEIQNIASTYFNENTLETTKVIQFIDTNINSDFEQSNPSEFKIAQNIKKRHAIITENTYIPSAAYTFTFNNSENYKDIDFSFFRVRLVSAGNLTTLLSSKKDENNKKTLFKTPIAQYIRTDLEYKKFWNLASENVLALRSFLGIAFPYNNSNSIPFSRSYFIGGPNDLRAWKIYDLGPGSTKTGLEYNVGNLKFLSSLEYRFKILNSIKGAFFVDAGNIWDVTNSELTEAEAKFKNLNSLKDIAIGSGFGIRYDLSFILLRLDVGFKTYEPYNSSGKKWLQNYNFKNNVYNFGISYPF